MGHSRSPLPTSWTARVFIVVALMLTKMWMQVFFLALSVCSLTLVFTSVKNLLFTIPPVPIVNDKVWWGSGEPFVNENTDITPFSIKVSEAALTDLKQRLINSQPFQPPLEGVGQQYGFNTNFLKEVVDFWLHKYDWKQREKVLNQFPQYTVSVQGLKIHFLHVKPKTKKGMKVIPLLLLHGWPSSPREFYKMIPLLNKQIGGSFVFEVIVPSLPGFSFSEPAFKPGLNPTQIAIIFKNLMARLGFARYYIHGGDWGGQVVTLMATLFPEKIIGVHSNFCFVNTPLAHLKLFLGRFFPSLIVDESIRDKVYPLANMYIRWVEETGYMHLQATKPDTIGVALKDSPVGLAAYLLEKYSIFTNPNWKNLTDGGLTKKFKMEDLLDNVMIYWITGCITSSMRLYAELYTEVYLSMKLAQIPTWVPSGCARFSHELVYQPEAVLKEKFANLVHVADYEGGHFAALEEPEILARDISLFVEKVENFNV